MIFETERTTVRVMRKSDLPGFAELESNPNVVKYTGYPTASAEEAQKDLDYILENYEMTLPKKLIYAVIHKDSNAFLGTVALLPYKENTWEIGYRFLQRHWGQGYASELVPALIHYGLQQEHIDAIYAEADVENTASIKLLERYMTFQEEAWNEKLKCTDRRYVIRRERDSNTK